MANRFTTVKRGYDPAEVDEYIDQMEGVIRSYKDKDTAIKNAILSAQVAADNIIASARNRSVIIKEQSVKKVTDIISSVSVQRQKLDAFKQEYQLVVSKYLKEVAEYDIAQVTAKIDDLEKFLERFTSDSETDSPQQ